MKNINNNIFLVLVFILIQLPVFSQQSKKEKLEVEVLHEALHSILDVNTQVEVLVEGLRWTEGPLWVEAEKMLLFSEIPSNTVYKWTEQKGKELYLNPSGYTSNANPSTREPGSNGLLLDKEGNLVLCQHGDRRIARMKGSLKTPIPIYKTVVDSYDNKRLNSPNDAVYHPDGDLYFTDPPYGLPTQNDIDPSKEISFNGVFVFQKDGNLTLLTDKLSRPNGIALFPYSNKLLVSNSDVKNAAWYIIETESDTVRTSVFYDATPLLDGSPGLPDGLKISKNNIVFASGQGGVWIFDSTAKLLGKIKFKMPVSNVALSDDEKYMYLTNTGRVIRIPLK
ncbi:SMP-30/gluconolactonase/LRE family protein [Sphingobacterium sp. SGL-16]|uniref:SMP-30/gluconolactonase/LRE family protein n=1 Tax=Sphingobacterium sp. SGL-16 TaxID=2710883 RepID=UPI0013EA9AD1|nr:SMP-30/gluconolactonase/LRE family protein [Sphingobacterium sp. SGL-16]NGM72100.1 SMP-30/gluconolactonase/LRE family protein [Sphingobacterium sp. SGL-16]